MSGLLEIGMRGLIANEVAMEHTAQNIANADTPFFSRRETVFAESYYNAAGQGVVVSNIKRVIDTYANINLYSQTANFSQSEIYYKKSAYLETMLEDESKSPSKALNELFSALEMINLDPSSKISRELYLNKLNVLVSNANSLQADLQEEQNFVNNAIVKDVAMVNQIVDELLQVNLQLENLTGESQFFMLDAQDKLLNDLSKYVDVLVNTHDDNTIDVMMSNGVSLLFADQTYSINAQASSSTSAEYDLFIKVNNSSSVKVTSLVQEGDLAGLMNYQKDVLDPAQRALVRLELVIAQELNQQNQVGMDLNGNLGAAIFQDMNGSSAQAARVYSNSNNQGSAQILVDISNATQLTTSNYLLKFSSATDFSLTRNDDGKVLVSSSISSLPQIISADGMQITLPANGSFSAGDVYTIAPTAMGAAPFGLNISDSNLLAFAWPVVVSSANTNQGTGKILLTEITDTTTADFANPKQLSPPYIVQFTSSTSFDLLSALDNSVVESGLVYDPVNGSDIFPVAADGFDPGYRVFLSGHIGATDRFYINYNDNGIGDNRNGLVFSDIFQEGVLDDGSVNFVGAFRELSQNVSLQVNFANNSLESYRILFNQAVDRKDQVSGVSLQEETVNLTQMQQAYQANAQLIETAQRVFDVLLSAFR